MKMVYMVHKGKNCFLTYNKREAVQFAKQNDCLVRSLSYQYYKDCHFCMDYPTFYALSEPIS
jgi:hypothetical protein